MVYKANDIKLLAVQESISAYAKTISTAGAQANQLNCIRSDFFQNKLLVIQFIQTGLPFDLFEKIKAITPFSEEDWANYLNLSVKTLQRNKKEVDFLFKPIHSEKIIELAEIAYFGHEIFDTKEKFYSWLFSNNYSLGNQLPSSLLQNSYGKEMVMAELNRIDHGVFV
ncbi:MAG: putative toxin-antitoxin system antitoxin component (TIGR02293 family) [Vicingaceae bacterium]|jgi:putative toxin-antitoxin system antitoxin component (TIGR02293 family)